MGKAIGQAIASYIGIFIRRLVTGFKYPVDHYKQPGDGFYNYMIGLLPFAIIIIIVNIYRHLGHVSHP